jgi:long-chain acyl-CoA synthetase
VVFKPFHDNLGGNFIGFISGGAPFDPEVGKFFRRIGLDVYPGYGLSEASPVVSVDYAKNANLKSVGFMMDSLEAKIDPETQELLLRGPQVMKGYYKQEEMTKEVIDEEGWLHTGDMAKFDKNGRLFITGRIKNMIVLPGGKKVFPEEVEAVIETSEYIKEVCVLSTVRQTGEKKGTEEVTAVLVAKDIYYEENDEKTVEALVIEDVKKKILRVTQYKRPTNIIVRREELPKTTTRKVKRKEVKELIEAI